METAGKAGERDGHGTAAVSGSVAAAVAVTVSVSEAVTAAVAGEALSDDRRRRLIISWLYSMMLIQ